jgi:hypothetical protein
MEFNEMVLVGLIVSMIGCSVIVKVSQMNDRTHLKFDFNLLFWFSLIISILELITFLI